MPQKTVTDVTIGAGAATLLPAWAAHSQDLLAYIALLAGCCLAVGRLVVFCIDVFQRYRRGSKPSDACAEAE